jgi:hypothetical protein
MPLFLSWARLEHSAAILIIMKLLFHGWEREKKETRTIRNYTGRTEKNERYKNNMKL